MTVNHRFARPRGSRLLGPALLCLLVALCEASAGQPQPSFQLVVHASNPIGPVPSHWVAKLFLKKIERWPDCQAVRPVDLEAPSPTRADFSEAIHGKSAPSIRRYWQRQIFTGAGVPPPEVGSDQEVLDFVREWPGAIGYVSAEARLGQDVRPLEIDANRQSPWGDCPSTPDRESPEAASPPPPIEEPPAAPPAILAALEDGAVWRSVDDGLTWMLIHGDSGGSVLVGFPDRSVIVAEGGSGLSRSNDRGRNWQRLTELPGGRSVAATSEALFALAEGQIWRSLDQGLGFSPIRALTHPDDSILAVDAGGDELLLADATAIWRADPLGRQWRRLGTLPAGEIRQLLADPGAAGVLYAVAAGTLFKSADGGVSWAGLDFPEDVEAVALTAEALLAVGAGGLYRSFDGGRAWESVVDLNDVLFVAGPAESALRITRDPSGDLWASSDGGRTWRRLVTSPVLRRLRRIAKVPPPPPPAPSPVPLLLACSGAGGHVAAVAVDPVDTAVVYAAGERGIYKSVDRGATWAFAGRGLEIADVHALAVDPVRPEILYAGTHGAGVFKSFDGAATWRPARSGLADPVVHSLLIDPNRTAVLYAGTASGLFVSADAGRSWRRHGVAAASRSGGRAVLSLASDPRFPAFAGAASSGGELWVGKTASASWTRLASPVTTGGAPPGDTSVCARSASARRGRHPWQLYGVDPAGLRVRCFQFDPYEPDVFYAATALGLWGSEDGGAAWRRMTFDANVAAVVAVEPFGFLAAAGDGLWRSDDRGGTWRRLPLDEPAYALATAAGVPPASYAGLAGGRLGISRDGGQSWTAGPLTAVPGREILAETAPLVARTTPAARPDEVTPAARGLWQALGDEPPMSARCRTLVANELLGRAPAAYEGPVRAALEQALEEALARQDRPPPAARAPRFSPRERWLLARYDLQGCRHTARETRLFDLDALSPLPGGPGGGSRHWGILHDLALEPPHLLPRFILPGSGIFLAWSDNDRFLATREGATVWVWDLDRGRPRPGAPARDPASPRTLERQAWDLGAAWRRCLNPEAAGPDARDSLPDSCDVALSGDGRWLAFSARDGGSAVVRLARREAADVRVEEVWSLPAAPGRPASWQALRFTADHRLLGFAADGSLWALRLGETPPATPVLETGRRWGEVVADPGGRWLAAGGDRLLVWPLASGASLAKPIDLPVAGQSRHLLFSRDGRWLAADSSGGQTVIFDLESRSPEDSARTLDHRDELGVFSRDGRWWLAYGSTVQALDLEANRTRVTGRGAIGAPLTVTREWPRMLKAPPLAADDAEWYLGQGRRWLLESRRDRIHLWSLGHRPPAGLAAQIGRLGPIDPDRGRSDRHAWLEWPAQALGTLSAQALRDLACQAVGRNLDRDEWRRLLGDEPWQPTCVRRGAG